YMLPPLTPYLHTAYTTTHDLFLSALRPFLFLPLFFFFNDTATTEIYTLSLHDALPIYHAEAAPAARSVARVGGAGLGGALADERSEEHTSELQSLTNLVCRLLLEKKKKT